MFYGGKEEVRRGCFEQKFIGKNVHGNSNLELGFPNTFSWCLKFFIPFLLGKIQGYMQTLSEA